jgi:cation transport ATPase
VYPACPACDHSLNGIKKADVFLSSEKAIIQLDPSMVRVADIRMAVKEAGYSVPEQNDKENPGKARRLLISRAASSPYSVLHLVLLYFL